MAKPEERLQARVNRILPFSCVDGPGNRLVIFLQGCNYQCLNCHNPQTINHCNHCAECVMKCPSSALSLDKNNKVVWHAEHCTHCDICVQVCQYKSDPKITLFSVQKLIDVIYKQRFFIQGITLSGGEATLQLPFILALFKQIKQHPELKSLSCFVDSNGSLSLSGWQQLLPFLDGAMIDLKSWQNDTHLWLVGRENHRVFQSIQFLAKMDKLYEIRLLHIPKISDFGSEIEKIGEFLHSLPEKVKVRLNAFAHHGVVGEALAWKKCSRQDIEELRNQLSQYTTKEIIIPSVIIE